MSEDRRYRLRDMHGTYFYWMDMVDAGFGPDQDRAWTGPRAQAEETRTLLNASGVRAFELEEVA